MLGVWQIAPNLFQANLLGSCTPAYVKVTCTKLSELPSAFSDPPVHVVFPFDDKPELPFLLELNHVAEFAAAMWLANRKVLVNCNAGENRSGLVIGRIMQIAGRRNVVAVIQHAHPGALQNRTFVDYLNSLE